MKAIIIDKLTKDYELYFDDDEIENRIRRYYESSGNVTFNPYEYYEFEDDNGYEYGYSGMFEIQPIHYLDLGTIIELCKELHLNLLIKPKYRYTSIGRVRTKHSENYSVIIPNHILHYVDTLSISNMLYH